MIKYISVLIFFLSSFASANELRPSTLYKSGGTIFQSVAEVEQHLKNRLPEGDGYKKPAFSVPKYLDITLDAVSTGKDVVKIR